MDALIEIDTLKHTTHEDGAKLARRLQYEKLKLEFEKGEN
jgi:hypothetical protein